MNLTKGKISKLYGKKRQSLRKPKRSGARNRKTFRKRHFNLATKSLKRYGGMDGVQDDQEDVSSGNTFDARAVSYGTNPALSQETKTANDAVVDEQIGRQGTRQGTTDLSAKAPPQGSVLNKKYGDYDDNDANSTSSKANEEIIPSSNIVSDVVGNVINDQAQEAKDASELATKSAVSSSLLASNIMNSDSVTQAIEQAAAKSADRGVHLSDPNIIKAIEQADANLSAAKTDAPAAVAPAAVAPTATAPANPGPSPLDQQSRQDNDLSNAINTIINTLVDKVAARLGGPNSPQNGYETVNRDARVLAEQSASDKANMNDLLSRLSENIKSQVSSKMSDIKSQVANGVEPGTNGDANAVAPVEPGVHVVPNANGDVANGDAVVPDAVVPVVPGDASVEPNAHADNKMTDPYNSVAHVPLGDEANDAANENVVLKPEVGDDNSVARGVATNDAANDLAHVVPDANAVVPDAVDALVEPTPMQKLLQNEILRPYYTQSTQINKDDRFLSDFKKVNPNNEKILGMLNYLIAHESATFPFINMMSISIREVADSLTKYNNENEDNPISLQTFIMRQGFMSQPLFDTLDGLPSIFKELLPGGKVSDITAILKQIYNSVVDYNYKEVNSFTETFIALPYVNIFELHSDKIRGEIANAAYEKKRTLFEFLRDKHYFDLPSCEIVITKTKLDEYMSQHNLNEVIKEIKEIKDIIEIAFSKYAYKEEDISKIQKCRLINAILNNDTFPNMKNTAYMRSAAYIIMNLFPNQPSEKIKSPVAPFVPVEPNDAVNSDAANVLAHVVPGANAANENDVLVAPNNLMDNNDAYAAGELDDKLHVSDPAANAEIDLDDNQVKELSSPIQQFGESKITNNQVDDDDHEFHDTRELQDDNKTNIPFSSQNKPNKGGRNKRTRRFKVHRKKATRRYRTGK